MQDDGILKGVSKEEEEGFIHDLGEVVKKACKILVAFGASKILEEKPKKQIEEKESGD